MRCQYQNDDMTTNVRDVKNMKVQCDEEVVYYYKYWNSEKLVIPRCKEHPIFQHDSRGNHLWILLSKEELEIHEILSV